MDTFPAASNDQIRSDLLGEGDHLGVLLVEARPYCEVLVQCAFNSFEPPLWA